MRSGPVELKTLPAAGLEKSSSTRLIAFASALLLDC